MPVETSLLPGTVSHSLSILDLVGQADLIVKIVLLILLLAWFWARAWAAARRSEERGLCRGHARMAAERRQGAARHPQYARQPAAAHRAGDECHGRPRNGARRTVHGLSRHGRLNRAVCRAVRYGLGHHG